MIWDKQTSEIKEICKDLLENKKVNVILAYTDGGVDGTQIPCFVKDVSELDKIEWGDRCNQHLAPYLHGRKDKVGIVAKPCDVRAIVQYLLEKQISRENVYIIGVDCIGMKDAEGKYRAGCAECKVRKPLMSDSHVTDDRVETLAIDPSEETGEDLAKNLEKFQKEIDKCILCFSCRQACYGCYCKNCFIERDTPDWQPTEADAGTKMTFHLGRAMHLSGRCIECGSCESACASGVNVRYIIKEVTKFIGDTYEYEAGMSEETQPAMLTHAFDDKEIGFLGGDHHA